MRLAPSSVLPFALPFAAILALAAPARAGGGSSFQPAGVVSKCTTAPEVSISIQLVARGAWIGASTGARCFVPRKDGALDAAALDTELMTLVGSLPVDCTRPVTLAGDPGVSYQDVITAMDHAIKAGLTDVALSDPKGLPVHFDDTTAREQKAPHCTAPATPAKPAPAASKATGSGSSALSGSAPAPGKADLASAPVVVISRTEVSLAGKKIADVKTLAHGKGTIAALVKALAAIAPTDHPVLILQADASTDAALVNRVIESGKQAGFDNVLFAVKSN